MRPGLTICMVTSRQEPKLQWFFDSLLSQIEPQDSVEVIIVDFYAETRKRDFEASWLRIVEPKPTVWQGKHRLTKEDWWAVSNARNTGIALTETEWFCTVDDRMVLGPDWLWCARQAMQHKQVVCGSYEKRINMTVERGRVIELGELVGEDCRKHGQRGPVFCGGSWTFGCNILLPTEWALDVNGFSEDYCDGISMEDVIFGMTLENRKFPILYDPRMAIIEDRTPSELDRPMHRKDKDPSPLDKSHRLLEVFKGATASKNSYNLRELREKVLAGEPFPPPTASPVDWYDGEPLKDMMP